jgi:uncharacterized protein DUF1585
MRIAVLLALLLVVQDTAARRALPDYRYFRALSIDLQGRPPTRDELAAFEQPTFDLDAWLASHLTGPGYAERLRRVYMDALRLEVGPSFQFVPPALVLRRYEVQGPDGPTYVYFRRGQRRIDAAIDGGFCFTRDESGLETPPNAQPVGTAKPIPRALFEARTTLVKPWWIYADYRATAPLDRMVPDWSRRFPGFQPVPALLADADGKPTQAVRVCREEAQTVETGTVFASGRTGGKVKKGGPPNDTPFARANKGRAVSCLSGTGFQSSAECGCGIGLERCVPGASSQFDPPAFVMPSRTPLGNDLPFEATPQPASAWLRMWWGEEAKHALDRIFVEDRDFRELLTSHTTVVNGPLAQFYRSLAGATCCGPAAELGYTEPVPLVERTAVPDALVPEDTATWLPVADRGPRAAGILTMPIFLTKYGSRRARAHVAYSAFLCKDFVADAVKLAPSTEPDLTKRPGCSACHTTLEPMAAYFTRIAESDWSYLPADKFPLAKKCDRAKGPCATLYDPAFGQLRGAYASPAHAEDGPAGLAQAITTAPEFAPCVVQSVASSLLGRPLVPEDEAWKAQLAEQFVAGGYRMRGLVKAIVTSARYREANDQRRP